MAIAGTALAVVAGLMIAPANSASAKAATLRVGSLDLVACSSLPGGLPGGVSTERAWCGQLSRLWDPARPATGSVNVGFVWIPARQKPAVGTVMYSEGGPGLASTASLDALRRTLGTITDRRNVLVVDSRGTGISEAINCPALQEGTSDYDTAAAACGRSLGARSASYVTVRSVDDAAAVAAALGVTTVDFYGDSYGTFYGQVLANRHPGLLRSLVLDASFPIIGESAWWPLAGSSLRTALRLVCRRSAACAAVGGDPVQRLDRLVRQLRSRPLRGTVPDATGRLVSVSVTPADVANMAYGAVSAPTVYRELDAAVRAALAGDRLPIARMVAEYSTSSGTSDYRVFSWGQSLAAGCYDYPQLVDLGDSVGARRRQRDAQIAAQKLINPGLYGPFTIDEYVSTYWSYANSCTTWAAPPGGRRPPAPAEFARPQPAVPVLILSGDLDTLTTTAEGRMVLATFPNARLVVVANAGHVSALGVASGCVPNLVRRFINTNVVGDSRCAAREPAIRAVGRFSRFVAQQGSATVARAAAATVADAMTRYSGSYTGRGRGLRGGTWRSASDGSLQLSSYRWAVDLAVSGRVTVSSAGVVRAVVRIRGGGHTGSLTLTWSGERGASPASAIGRWRGQRVATSFAAP